MVDDELAWVEVGEAVVDGLSADVAWFAGLAESFSVTVALGGAASSAHRWPRTCFTCPPIVVERRSNPLSPEHEPGGHSDGPSRGVWLGVCLEAVLCH